VAVAILLIAASEINPEREGGLYTFLIYEPLKELSPFRNLARLIGPPMPKHRIKIDLSAKGNIGESTIRIYDKDTYHLNLLFMVKNLETIESKCATFSKSRCMKE
jgi:hypothetical protein